MANTYDQLATTTVGVGGAASIDFTSIPSTYTDLVLKISGRSSFHDGTTWSGLAITFNGNAVTGKRLYGVGSGTASSDSSTPFGGAISGDTATASTFGNQEIYIPNYAGSSYKSSSIDSASESNSTAALLMLNATLWSYTAAVNQITLTPAIGSFVEYSTAYLYGVKNA
tara:strand:+ start:70 stop:576 length:507 start_codon:yes stop_codon:yes gene_type:complete